MIINLTSEAIKPKYNVIICTGFPLRDHILKRRTLDRLHDHIQGDKNKPPSDYKKTYYSYQGLRLYISNHILHSNLIFVSDNDLVYIGNPT